MAERADPLVLLVGRGDGLERRYGEQLATAGFRVASVDSAGECLRLVESGGIGGILSEYDLPDLDGLRLVRSVRISHPSLPFVLIPREGSEAIAGESVAAGVSGYLPEDADPATVVSRLQDSLQREMLWSDEEARRRYRSLVEISPVPINLFDGTGESVWCNDATVDLLGLDGRDDLVGHSIFEFIHPDDHELAREELGDVIARKESVGPTQMRLRRSDGEVRHVQVSTAVGRFLGEDIGQAVVVDVTPLREAQIDLQRERQFVEDTLDTLQDVFYVVDADGKLVRWNETATAVTGHDDEELASMDVTDLFAGDDGRLIRESIARVLEEGRDTVEARLLDGRGRSHLYEFRSRRLRTGDGDGEERVVGIGRDVSERRERERQLKVLERWLRHNIRNELNTIQGTAEMIRRGDVDDVREAARLIEERAEHLVGQANRERELVDLLVNPSEPVPIDVAAVVERRVEGLRSRYASADIELVRDGEVRALAVPEIGAAVEELVENAIEHNDTGSPKVRIEVGSDDRDSTSIRIVDDGPGIPRRERELLLFEREIGQLQHGAGLGLLFAHWVVRVSGGDIAFGDNEPRGSVVRLTLPTVGRDHPTRTG